MTKKVMNLVQDCGEESDREGFDGSENIAAR
jgi:hypothetical protein